MATIKMHNGIALVNVEVSEEFAVTYAKYEKAEAIVERKETRRHQSLDKSLNNGFDIPDENANVEEAVINQEEIQELHKAIRTLKPKQQWLVAQIFFQGRSMVDIALEIGVSQAAITQQMQVINGRLKKYFEKFLG